MSGETGADGVAGAIVAATNTGTNQVRRVRANGTANSTVPFLVPGVYDLEVGTQGFKSATRKGTERFQMQFLMEAYFSNPMLEKIVQVGEIKLLTVASGSKWPSLLEL